MATLIEEIKLNGEYQEAFVILKNAGLIARVGYIKDFFICACRDSNDDKALLFFDWFLKANTELSNSEKRGGILESHYATLAMEIYPYVPNDRFPSFPKTRGKILPWIADWCYRTKDEGESDRLFNFLITLKFECSENEKVLVETFKRILINFPTTRFFRHITLINAELKKGYRHGLIRIREKLLDLWWDSHKPEEMIRIISVIQPLEEVPNEMFDYMVVRANGVARFNKAINGLIISLKKSIPNIIGIAVSQDGEISVEYSENHFGSVSMIIAYKTHQATQFLDDVFKNASEIVASWKAYYPDYSVDLIMKSIGLDYCHKEF